MHRYDLASVAILQRLESLESNLGSLIRDCLGREHGDIPSQDPLQAVLGGQREPQNGLRSQDYSRGTGYLDDTTNTEVLVSHGDGFSQARGTESPPSSATLLRASSDMSIESMLRWSIFRQHLSHLADRALAQDLGKRATATDERTGEDRLVIGEDELILHPDVVYPLVENFIINNLPSNPILDPESLRQKVQHMVEYGLGWHGESCLVAS